jgi:hypothetical protein
MVYCCAVLVLVLVASACTRHTNIPLPPAPDIETTLFLIGDAGEPDPRQPTISLDSMRRQAAEAPQRTIIVFLGDNVYPDGIPVDSALNWPDARRRLAAQVDAVPPGARAIFLPGNHDWAESSPHGLYAIRLEEKLITALAKGRDIKMLPGNGCPGPVAVDVGRLRFIALDTQWWLHDYIVRDELSHCVTTIGGVTSALRGLVQSVPQGQVVIAAGHHPLMSGGEHGGYCGFSAPFRRVAGANQDILSGANRRMRDSLESAFSAKPPLLYAAGHDHNLQVLNGGPHVEYLAVSGAGSSGKAACAVYMRESYYVSQHRTGFMRVDILRNKGVLLSVYDFTGGGAYGVPFGRWLEFP